MLITYLWTKKFGRAYNITGDIMNKLIVKVGYNDSLSKIAERYNLTTKILSSANNNITEVEEGDYLIIPFKAKAIHTVRPLETLNEIAQKYCVNVDKLKSDNNIVAPLFVGQQIIIMDD